MLTLLTHSFPPRRSSDLLIRRGTPFLQRPGIRSELEGGPNIERLAVLTLIGQGCQAISGAVLAPARLEGDIANQQVRPSHVTRNSLFHCKRLRRIGEQGFALKRIETVSGW